jgi:uncharacterized protein (DUF1330 family)
MPVYISATLQISDRELYRKYEEGFMPIFNEYAGSFLAIADDPLVIEGDAPCSRAVLISFPTREDALAWIESPEYQAIADYRRQASTGSVLLIPGLPGS